MHRGSLIGWPVMPAFFFFFFFSVQTCTCRNICSTPTLGLVRQGLVGSVRALRDDTTLWKRKMLKSLPLKAPSYSSSPSSSESKKLKVLDEKDFFHDLDTSVWRSVNKRQGYSKNTTPWISYNRGMEVVSPQHPLHRC